MSSALLQAGQVGANLLMPTSSLRPVPIVPERVPARTRDTDTSVLEPVLINPDEVPLHARGNRAIALRPAPIFPDNIPANARAEPSPERRPLGDRAIRYGITGTVGVMHLLMAYALATGLAQKAVDVVKGPLEVSILDVHEAAKTPPPPPMMQQVPPPFVPPPEISLASVAAAPSLAITTSQQTAPSGTLVPASDDPVHPNSQPDYPDASRRMGEEGRVVMRLYVLPDGSVSDALVTRSSGSPRLDSAAVEEAKRNWHYIPAKQAGRSVASWVLAAVVFSLERS